VQKKGKIEDALKEDKLVANLLVDLYVNAKRRKDSGRFEDAISRLYRLLELISQYRLLKYKIATSRPDYKHMPDLEEKYKDVTKKLYGGERYLPAELGIKDGHILLFILEDDIWKTKKFDDLKNFLGPIRLRDDSIIAHGVNVIGEKGLRAVESISKELLNKVFSSLGIDLGKLIEQHNFLKL